MSYASNPIAKHMRSRRIMLGLTVREAARRAKCAASYWSDVERDKRFPSPAMVRGVARALRETSSTRTLLNLCGDAEVCAARWRWR